MTLYFITDNDFKANEVTRLLSGFDVKIESFKFPDLDGTLEYIASTKAFLAYQKLKKPVFCDATGLFINAIGGFPGTKTDVVMKNYTIPELAALVEGCEDKSAYAQTSVGIYVPMHEYATFSGVLHGTIVAPENDSLRPNKFNRILSINGRRLCDFTDEERDKVSHRAIAFNQVKEWLISNNIR